MINTSGTPSEEQGHAMARPTKRHNLGYCKCAFTYCAYYNPTPDTCIKSSSETFSRKHYRLSENSL